MPVDQRGYQNLPSLPSEFLSQSHLQLTHAYQRVFLLLEIPTKTALGIITFPHQSGKDTSVSDPQVGLLGYLCESSCTAF